MAGRSRHFNLLIVFGDGRRILRLNLTRALAYGALALLALVASTLAAIWGDYLSLSRQRGEMATLRGLTEEQRRLLDTLDRQLAEIQTEVAGWQNLHARIWEPLGPEGPGAGEKRGVGGSGPTVPPEPEAGAGRVATLVERLAARVNEEGQKLRALERLMGRAGKVLAALPSRWPVRGAVNSEFGRRISPWSGAPEFHSGIDIAADTGTPVKAPAPGIVVFAGAAPDYGNTVIIDHGHEIKTLFGHLQKVQVVPGQKVERGQQIALTGNTGKSSGPHLHYGIVVKGQSVDPRGYLWD